MLLLFLVGAVWYGFSAFQVGMCIWVVMSRSCDVQCYFNMVNVLINIQESISYDELGKIALKYVLAELF